MHAPIEYQPRFEVPEDGEGDTQADLLDVLHGIADTTFKDSGQPLRSVHAKSHGLLRAELHVLPGLPAMLAQGLFATPGTYPVVMRLSTTQDFVMVNSTTFLNAGPKAFLGGLKMLAATTDKAPSLKVALSGALRQVEGLLERAGTDSAALKGMGGHPATHPLGETYYSQTAILFGRYMAKVSLAPVAVGLTQLHGVPLDVKADPVALRHAVCDHFAQQGGEWELRVQLCTNIEEMPIEDASFEWPESVSPFVAVARLVAPPQLAWSEALSAAIDEGMSFSPWHGLAAHRPLGSVNRVRKAAYEMSARLRARRRGAAITQPRSLDDLPFGP